MRKSWWVLLGLGVAGTIAGVIVYQRAHNLFPAYLWRNNSDGSFAVDWVSPVYWTGQSWTQVGRVSWVSSMASWREIATGRLFEIIPGTPTGSYDGAPTGRVR